MTNTSITPTQIKADKEDDLPPLPEPTRYGHYAADQMRAYGESTAQPAAAQKAQP